MAVIREGWIAKRGDRAEESTESQQSNYFASEELVQQKDSYKEKEESKCKGKRKITRTTE